MGVHVCADHVLDIEPSVQGKIKSEVKKEKKEKGGGKADRVPTPPCGTLNKMGASLTLC